MDGFENVSDWMSVSTVLTIKCSNPSDYDSVFLTKNGKNRPSMKFLLGILLNVRRLSLLIIGKTHSSIIAYHRRLSFVSLTKQIRLSFVS
jgi:hypothetical protein